MKALYALGGCALLCLAACSVPLDGAPCDTTANCPSGQACVAGTCVEGASAPDAQVATPGDAGMRDAGVADTGPLAGPDAGCVDDPGCTTAGEPACDPDGSNLLGVCQKVDGCLRVQDLAACPSSKQTCPVGGGACACPSSTCTVGVLGCSKDGALVLECVVKNGEACAELTKQKADCTADGLVCGKSGGKASCVCPAPAGGVLRVDPAAPASALAPSGALEPPHCRFSGITEALAVAAANDRVVLMGATNLHPMWAPETDYAQGALVLPSLPTGFAYVAETAGRSGTSEPPWRNDSTAFPDHTASALTWKLSGPQVTPSFETETFPLVLPPGVTLTTAECLTDAESALCTPRGYRLMFQGTATNAVILGDGAKLEGLTLLHDGEVTSPLVSCTAGAAELRRIALEGIQHGEVGISLRGTCSAVLIEPAVRQFTVAGVRSDSTGTLDLTSPLLMDNAVGLLIRAGVATVARGAAASAPDPFLRANGRGAVVGGGVGSATVTLRALEIADSKSVGLEVTGAQAKCSVEGVLVRASVGYGVSVTDGTLDGSQLTVRGGSSLGLVSTAGAVTLQNATLTGNTDTGVRVTGGQLDLGGFQIDSNGKDGLALESGTVTLTAPGTLSKNSANGLTATGGTLVLNGSTSGMALVGNNNGLALQGGTATLSGVTVRSSIGTGIRLGASTDLSLVSCSVLDSGKSGVLVEGGAPTLAMSECLVSGNGSAASGDLVGGLHFKTATTLGPFANNIFKSNAEAQIRFAVAGAWTADFQSTCAAPNTVSCYKGSGALGIVANLDSTVKAGGFSWESAAPASPTDFNGPVTATPACTMPIVTCP